MDEVPGRSAGIPQKIGQLTAVKDGHLIVVQQWAAVYDGRHVIAVNRDDRITQSIPMAAATATTRFARYCIGLERHAVTEDAARRWLTDHGLPATRHCAGCAEQLPLGALFCTGCGLPGGGVCDVAPAGCARRLQPVDA